MNSGTERAAWVARRSAAADLSPCESGKTRLCRGRHVVMLVLLAGLLISGIGCDKDSDKAKRGKGGSQPTESRPADAGWPTPEHQAMKETQAFLDGGGNANAKDNLGTTRLMDAAVNDFDDVARLLASKGADVNAKDDTLGQTALHFCAIGDNARAAEALIEKGANVNAADNQGRTPPHEAAAAGAVNVLKLLLAKGADVNASDGVGKTPLHRAATAGQSQAVELLLSAKADPAAKDKRGKTPLFYAQRAGDAKTLQLLKK